MVMETMRLKDVYPEETPDEFLELPVVFEDSWSTYEESGFVVVFDFFGELFKWEYQSSVFEESNEVYFDPEPITDSDLVLIKEEWKKAEGELLC